MNGPLLIRNSTFGTALNVLMSLAIANVMFSLHMRLRENAPLPYDGTY